MSKITFPHYYYYILYYDDDNDYYYCCCYYFMLLEYHFYAISNYSIVNAAVILSTANIFKLLKKPK